MQTTLDEALNLLKRWAAANRNIIAVGESGIYNLFVKGHIVGIAPSKIELFMTDSGVVSFDPHVDLVDYSDVREAPQPVRGRLETFYDEALMFRSGDESIMLFALLETGAAP